MSKASELLKRINEDLPKEILQKNPDKELVVLLKKGSDGGKGEFEKFLPKEVVEYSRKEDVSYDPVLQKDGNVKWVRVF